MEKIVRKIEIKVSMKLLSGLHIGGNKENVEIGGIDNPVIRARMKDNMPYIPGSSLKGKMRSLLEQINGIAEIGGGEKKELVDKTSACREIINLFGFADNKKPAKLIVRDAYLSEKSKEALENTDGLDMPYTEGKWENSIKRVEGTADNPRQTERIPAGVDFVLYFVINVWDDDDKKDKGKSLVDLLAKGLTMVENDYLGGNGSRGYGQVQFSERKDWIFKVATENNKWEMTTTKETDIWK